MTTRSMRNSQRRSPSSKRCRPVRGRARPALSWRTPATGRPANRRPRAATARDHDLRAPRRDGLGDARRSRAARHRRDRPPARRDRRRQAAHRARAAGRPGRRDRRQQPRGGSRAVSLAEDDRIPSRPHLPQARRAHARRASRPRGTARMARPTTPESAEPRDGVAVTAPWRLGRPLIRPPAFAGWIAARRRDDGRDPRREHLDDVRGGPSEGRARSRPRWKRRDRRSEGRRRRWARCPGPRERCVRWRSSRSVGASAGARANALTAVPPRRRDPDDMHDEGPGIAPEVISELAKRLRHRGTSFTSAGDESSRPSRPPVEAGCGACVRVWCRR